jgi:Delta7-sterol 5-desaturase
MAETAGKITLPSGETYSSAYAAILYGSPLENPCRNFNAWVNSFFFGDNFASFIIRNVGIEWAHYILCYLRNFLGAMFVYYGTAGVFHYFCYVHPMSKDIFKDRVRPSSETIWHQIKLAQKSIFVYVLLPVVDEYLIESGWTRTYFTIEEIGGWPMHIATMVLYFSFVEIGIYWMHRTLHTNKWLYKNIHMCHHQYKKPETLTPWASIAFNPIDGMLQASPYVAVLFFVPCHYLTHFGLLFFTAVRWTPNRLRAARFVTHPALTPYCRFGLPSSTTLWTGMWTQSLAPSTTLFTTRITFTITDKYLHFATDSGEHFVSLKGRLESKASEKINKEIANYFFSRQVPLQDHRIVKGPIRGLAKTQQLLYISLAQDVCDTISPTGSQVLRKTLLGMRYRIP